MTYAMLKTIHVTAVVLSGSGFFARGLGALGHRSWVRSRPARILPHVVDTVLLVSAVALAWTLRLSPSATPWLAAKIAGLLVYIGLGVVALRPQAPGSPRAGPRTLAWIAALMAFAYIVSVAVTKSPLGPLA